MRRYLFIDDATGAGNDAERYQKLLQQADVLAIDLAWPNREELLVDEGDVGDGIDGYILDINLKDQISKDGERFLGTGAGLAQDLRLLQALWPKEGQKPRPIVRLCAAQVFQDYLAGDNSTADIFDLGFDKETVGDIASAVRDKLVALPELYDAVQAAPSTDLAREVLGLSAEDYDRLHSRFRVAYEAELVRKPHEAVSFVIRQLIEPAGLLINEDLLAVRLGVDKHHSPSWEGVRTLFDACRYTGAANSGFARWWADKVTAKWVTLNREPLFRLSSVERVNILKQYGYENLTELEMTKESPGDKPWMISISNDPAMRLPVDPRYSFSLSVPVASWLDEQVWCLEQAKRNRASPSLSQDSRDRVRSLKPGAVS